MKRLMILIALLFVLVACSAVQREQPPAKTIPTAPPQAIPEVQPAPVPEPLVTPLVVITSVIELDADDDGFYLDGDKVGVLTVKKGIPLELTFNVRENDVYYGGLDFRGCGQDAAAKPGKSVTVSFIPVANCIIKSFWPASGVLKDSLELSVE